MAHRQHICGIHFAVDLEILKRVTRVVGSDTNGAVRQTKQIFNSITIKYNIKYVNNISSNIICLIILSYSIIMFIIRSTSMKCGFQTTDDAPEQFVL